MAGETGWNLFGQTMLGVLGGGILGAAIGGMIGFAAPYIGAFLSSTFPLVAPVMLDGAVGYAVIGTVTGAQIGAAVLGAGLLMFAKGSGPRMGHNQYENKQFKQLVGKHQLTKEEARTLHDFISHQNYSYHEIEEIIFNLFRK